MRRRIAAGAVLAIATMLTLAGCTFFAPQATLIPYDASDGVSLNVGDVQLRNAFVVSPHGTDANLVGVLINTGKSAETVNVQYTSHTGGTAASTTVPIKLGAGAVLSLGNPGVPQVQLTGADVKAGAVIPIFLQYGSVSGKTVKLPVLTGSQSYYGNLKPTPSPTPTVPTACGTASPTGDEPLASCVDPSVTG